MDYKLSLREEAKRHITKGFVYYEEKSIGLGTRFVNEVEEILDYIEKYPRHYQIKYKNYREGILKVFPFVIIYEIFDREIIVYAVFPTKDNPNKKP